MSGIPVSIRLQKEPLICPQCGSASRIGRSLCLSCLLAQGLGTRVHPPQAEETLEDVLGELDVRDAEWRVGDYQILEEIGRGGIGVVYRARHRRRIVALKRILPSHADSRETLVRFRREAESAASVVHPNILPIYEVSESDDGLPFFSMKFAGGGSLLDAAPALRGEPRRAGGVDGEGSAGGTIRPWARDPASGFEAWEHFAGWTRRTAGERFRSGQMPGTNEQSDTHTY